MALSFPTGRWEHQERGSSKEYGKRETFKIPVFSQGSKKKKNNKGPASFKLRACMGGKKSPQIHHHHSGDKEPLERNRKLKNSGKLPTYPSPNSNFSTKLVLKMSWGRGWWAVS